MTKMKMTIPLPDHTTAKVTADNKIEIEFDSYKTSRDLWTNQFGIYLEDAENEKLLDYKPLRVKNNKLKLEK